MVNTGVQALFNLHRPTFLLIFATLFTTLQGRTYEAAQFE